MKRFTLAAALLLLPAVSFAQDVCAPSKVTDLTVAGVGKNSIVVNWTAPGDDCTSGTATTYDVRYSTSPITEGNFASATPMNVGSPNSAGTTQECADKQGLSQCTTYYVAMKTADENGFWSPLSNVVSTTALCSGSSQVACP
jgi:hypothetical protein